MFARTRWRVVEEPCLPAQATARWRQAREEGATGAVTSWGSGIPDRKTIRLYWEVRQDAVPPAAGEDLQEEDWTPHWRQSLKVVCASPSVTLVPAWEEAPPKVPGVLRIDPGMAFGAGDHPTTRLCLRLLDELASRGRLPTRVLDAGTGTGVLALAAARLGLARVDALDIDPFGFASCRRNAALNGLEPMVRPLLLSLDLLEGDYPLVIANVVASQLQAVGSFLAAKTAPGGRLLLSGFTAEAESQLREQLLGSMGVEERREEEGWVALLTRP